MTPDPHDEEIIELTEVIEEEDPPVQEVSGSEADEGGMDEASLEEELSDFFAKIEDDEDSFESQDPPTPTNDEDVRMEASEEDDFDLDGLFEDVDEVKGTSDVPADSGADESWEDIDLDLPGADEEPQPAAEENDDFSDLDDLFEDLEKGEEAELSATEEEPVIDLTEEVEPSVEVRPETVQSEEPATTLPAEITERLEALEDRLANLPDSLSENEIVTKIEDRLANVLAADNVPEELIDAVAKRVEESLSQKVDEKLETLRNELAQTVSEAPDFTEQIESLRADSVSREELNKITDDLRVELKQTIADTAPAAAAQVIREEIASLADELAKEGS